MDHLTSETPRLFLPDSLLLDDQIRPFLSDQTRETDPSGIQGEKFAHSNPGSDSALPGLQVEDEQSILSSDEKQPPALVEPKSTKRASLTSWVPEIISLLVAICCFISIFTLLEKFNGQPQPQLPYASLLNLSTLVALIATILRSMLENVLGSVIGQLKWRWFRRSTSTLSYMKTFDDASRGSWGSLVFLFSFFRPNLAIIGALITVLSTVIGSFSQQALQNVSCQKPSLQEQASVPIAQTVAGLGGLQQIGSNEPSVRLGVDLRAALIAGLTGSQSPNSLSPTCSSGNCTFTATDSITYSSIGFSSECVDVSSLIIQSGIQPWDTLRIINNSITTNYSLPNGMKLRYSVAEGSYSSEGGRWDTILATDLESNGSSLSLDNVKMTERQKNIVDNALDAVTLLMPTINPCQDPSYYVDYLGPESSPMPPVNTTSCPQLNLPNVDTLPGFFSVTAAMCFFYASIQHYNGSVVSGNLEEEIVYDPVVLQPPLNRTDLNGTTTEGIWYSGFSDHCIIDNVIYTNTSSNLSSVPGGLVTVGNITGPFRCFYGFNFHWYRALKVPSGSPLGYLIVGFSQDSCYQSGNYTSMTCDSAWWLSGFFNGGNATTESINALFARGFQSMTNQLRMIGTDWRNNPLSASGTVLVTDICTQFRWTWLIYPLILVIGTLILLLYMITSSHGMFSADGNMVWKSSVFPLLFYGLENQYQKRDATLSTAGELNAAAKTLKVRFSLQDDKWRLNPVEDGK